MTGAGAVKEFGNGFCAPACRGTGKSGRLLGAECHDITLSSMSCIKCFCALVCCDLRCCTCLGMGFVVIVALVRSRGFSFRGFPQNEKK